MPGLLRFGIYRAHRIVMFCDRFKIAVKDESGSAAGLACGALATGFFLTGAAGLAAGSVVVLAGWAAGFCGGSGGAEVYLARAAPPPAPASFSGSCSFFRPLSSRS